MQDLTDPLLGSHSNLKLTNKQAAYGADNKDIGVGSKNPTAVATLFAAATGPHEPPSQTVYEVYKVLV